jgi:hypothetical protein
MKPAWAVGAQKASANAATNRRQVVISGVCVFLLGRKATGGTMSFVFDLEFNIRNGMCVLLG